MKFMTKAAMAAAMAFACLAGSAQAQTTDRTYDNGPVWQIAYVETKPGKFDDYMAYVMGPYRQLQDAAKKTGALLDWHVLAVDNPREHEPDVVLVLVYKNMAALDYPLDDQDKAAAKVFGSLPKATQDLIKREDIRVLRGSIGARELVPLK